MNAIPEHMSREDKIDWLKRQREHYEEQEKACRLHADLKRAEAAVKEHDASMMESQGDQYGWEKKKAQEALLALMEEA
jgi:hypothetical protein